MGDFMTRAIATTDLCDLWMRQGRNDFAVLPPVFTHFGGRKAFSGPVRTVQCFEDNSLVKAALEETGWVDTPTGRVAQVLVVDGGASLRRALVGGNIAALAARNGWAGVLVDGCVRDTHELASCDLGICALALMPLPTVKRQTGQRDGAVQVQGVRILPGQFLYADQDGIVVCDQAVSLPD
jgi:regulator of ribonuclease activity A